MIYIFWNIIAQILAAQTRVSNTQVTATCHDMFTLGQGIQ